MGGAAALDRCLEALIHVPSTRRFRDPSTLLLVSCFSEQPREDEATAQVREALTSVHCMAASIAWASR